MASHNPVTRDPSPSWRLELLGGATLCGVGVRHRLERKSAALLALLTQGEQTRSFVAGVLWAASNETQARNNLRQCLFRLKRLTGVDLVEAVMQSGERLSLSSHLEVDWITLESQAFLGDDAGLVAVRGELLAHFDFEDCPDFALWLEAQRMRWHTLRIGAYRRMLRQSDAVQALGLALEWVQLEPLSEEAHRALALAHSAVGDRASALHVLRQLECTLRDELSAKPSPETTQLRETLERNQVVLERSAVVLPSGGLQSAVLVGRERQWAQLERAWTAGKSIVIRGAPGIGKTRLMLDFLAAKGRFDLIDARPGDASVPMSAFARSLRRVLAAAPNLELPGWVKTELARFIPAFSEAAPPSMSPETDKLRLLEAIFTVTEQRHDQGISAIALDDLQFMDAASVEMTRFNTERVEQLGVRTITAYRSGELARELEASIEQAAASGRLEIIDLEPLEETALERLVQSLNLNAPSSLTPQLFRSTGGNPLYTLETIRDLVEQNQLHDTLEVLPVPKLARQIIAQRFARRSPEAQRLAQVAAIAIEDFSLELAAFVLDAKPLELQAPLHELETAQIMRGEQFQHDLLLEAVKDGISLVVKRYLHRRCAAYLEGINADPARIAQHWLEANDQSKAAFWILEAQSNLMQNGFLEESVSLLEHALNWPVAAKDRLMMQATLAERYATLAKFDEAEKLTTAVIQSTSNPEARAIAYRVLAEIRAEQGRYEAALALIDYGEPLALITQQKTTLDGFQVMRAIVAYRQQRYNDALRIFEPMLEDYRNTAMSSNFLSVATSLISTYEALGKFPEARQLHKEFIRVATQIQSLPHLVIGVSNRLVSAIHQGHAEDVLDEAEEALKLGEYTASITLRSNLAFAYYRLHRNEDSIKHYSVLLERVPPVYQCMALANLAVLYGRIGRNKDSKNALEKALELLSSQSYWGAKHAVIRAVLTVGTNTQWRHIEPEFLELDLSSLSEASKKELEELVKARTRPA